MSRELNLPRLASYVLFFLALVVIARFDLGPCALAALVSFMILDITETRLRALGIRQMPARWAALAVFLILATALTWIFVQFLSIGLNRMPVLLDTVLPRMTALSESYGLEFPVDNAREFRDLLVASAKENTSSIGKTSGLLTRGFFQVIVGIVTAMLRFLTPVSRSHAGHLYDSLRLEFNARVLLFMRSFERVVCAQVGISTLNTALTALFLHVMGFPFRSFLTLTTLVCGMIPVVGNIISNIFITAAGLTVSTHMAMFGLVYLIVIHKLEYILNSRIIGGSIDTPMWMTLMGLVVGEALMGVPGVLLAPALLHYAREELRAISSSAD